MKEGLNDPGVIGREVSWWDELVVMHDLNFGVIGFQPFWNLRSLGHEVYFIHPRGEFFDGSQAVFQRIMNVS